jgi:hypothetical protein
MEDKSIKQRKRPGDWRIVAEILGKTTEATRESFYRKEGKTYEKVRETLIKVIEARESFINQLKNSEL